MNKRVLVLARRDTYEAIRVAAGLTIRNTAVDFIFMIPPARDDLGRIQNADMLELAEIVPRCTLKGEADTTFCEDIAPFIHQADRVVSF